MKIFGLHDGCCLKVKTIFFVLQRLQHKLILGAKQKPAIMSNCWKLGLIKGNRWVNRNYPKTGEDTEIFPFIISSTASLIAGAS